MAMFSLRYRIAALAIASLGVFAPAALAQSSNSNTVDPNEGFNSPDGEANLLESPTGAFDLIHNSILRTGTTPAEFQTRQRDRLNTEAASFRELQQRRIRESQMGESDESAE